MIINNLNIGGFDMKINFASGETLNVTAKCVEYGVRFPNTDKNDRTLHNKFRCTIYNPETKAKMSITWYDSHNNYMLGIDEINEEMARSILLSTALDATSYDTATDFEDFCGEFGYSDDSIKALKIYNACKRISKGWERVSDGLGEATTNEILCY